jgi:hypothetical protein
MAEQTTKTTPERPAYGRPIQEIVADLSKDVPAKMLAEKSLKGNKITYLPWYRAARMLDYYAPGWQHEIRDIKQIGSQVVVIVRLSIPAAEGWFYREATGIEEEEVKGYGDTTSNAEGMALRRAAAKFGLARGLYER